MRILGLVLVLLAGFWAGNALACNVPNPNISAPPFVDGCDLPAVALNNLAGGQLSSNTSPLVADGQQYIQGTQQFTANQIYRMATSVAVTNFDTVRSVGVVPSPSTVTNVNQFAAYQVNQNPLGVGIHAGSGVLYFGMGVAAVDNSAEWGLNPVLTDNTSYVPSSGLGRVLQNEYDFNVTSPNTNINGLFVAGASSAQPATAFGYRCRPLGAAVSWTSCFISDAGTSLNALVAGANAVSGMNIPSQFVAFNFFDAVSASQNYYMRVNATQQFEVGSSVGSGASFVVDGLIRTPDSPFYANAFEAGAKAASGLNIGSQPSLWHYFNGSGTSLFATAQVNTFQTLAFGGASNYSFDQLVAAPLFAGNGVTGVSCNSVNAGTVTVSGGIVTHC